MFGHLVPPTGIRRSRSISRIASARWSSRCAIVATTAHVWYHHRDRRELRRPAALLLALVVVQITLGALTVLSRRDVWINSSTSSAARWC